LLHWDTKPQMESSYYCMIQESITNDVGSQLDGFLEFIGVDPELRTVLLPGFNTISASSRGVLERDSLFSLLIEPLPIDGGLQSSNDLVGLLNPTVASNGSLPFRLRPEVNNIEPVLDPDKRVRDVADNIDIAASATLASTFEAKPKRCALFRIDF